MFRHVFLAAFFLMLALPAEQTFAQTVAAPAVGQVGIVADPCTYMTPMPAMIRDYLHDVAAAKAQGKAPPTPTPAQMKKGMSVYRAWHAERIKEDFGQHCHYAAQNAKLPPADASRVVLFGDSITELWKSRMPQLFDAQFINRGISGQTTAQMVVRFQDDVIDLHPAVVQIMAGSNDIAGNTGPTSLAWIKQNIRTMVQLARAHGIRVLLASIPPSNDYKWSPDVDPRPAIAAMNAWLKHYAAQKCMTYVDYYTALVGKNAGMRVEYTIDGVHPDRAGYERMVPILKKAIAESASTCTL